MASPGRAGAATVPAIKLELDDSESDTAPEAARPQHDPARPPPQQKHAEAEAEATSSTDRVMKLTSQQCDELLEKGSLKFCEGCPVVYDFRRDGKTIEVREGIVRSAFVNIDRRRFEYEIERPTAAANEEPALDMAIEHQVAYANDCPVWIKPDETSGDEERVEARVLFAGPKEENGEMSIEYIVQYSGDENNDGVLRMEEGVSFDRVSCNTAEVGNMNHQRIGRRARDDNGGLEGDGRQDPIAQDQDEQRPPPVVVPDISPGCSQQQSRWGTKEEASNRVERAIQPTKRSSERGTAAKDKDELGGQRTTPRSGDRHPAADENGTLAQGMKPAPSIEGHSPIRADDDGETSALTCELSESPAGRAGAAVVPRLRSFDPAGAALTRADYPPPLPLLSPPPPAPAPVEHRKIKFQPPNPLRRQNSTASYEDARAKKQGAEATAGTGMSSLKAPLDKKTSADNSSSLSLVRQSKNGERLWCEVTVPLWMNYGAKDLFRHLTGVGEDGRMGHKTRRICDETGCSIHLSRCCPQNGVPLVITIKMQHIRACRLQDIERAMAMLEDSLLDFHGQRGAHKRLRFEMRSGAGGNVLPQRSKGGAVKVHESRWERLQELSCVSRRDIFVGRGGREHLSEDLTKTISDATGCHARVYAGDDECPLTLCAPYILVQGRDSEQVERAAAMVATASQPKHEQDQFNPDTADAKEMDNTGQIQSRKINFDPPDRLKRQNSAASEGGAPIKRSMASPTMATAEEQLERPNKLAKTGQALQRGFTDAKKPTAEALACHLTVPLWIKYNRTDLFNRILGVKEGERCGYRTRKILAETGCYVRLTCGNPKEGVPLAISIEENTSRTSSQHCDMHKAYFLVENDLFQFCKQREVNGRLRFELRAGATGNFFQPRAKSGAVSSGRGWTQLVELPLVKPGGIVSDANKKLQLSRDLQKSIQDVTGCSAEVHGGDPGRPLELCKPYILVQGKELDQVETATAMIMNTPQNTQRANPINAEGAEEGEIDCQDSHMWAL